MGGGMSALAFRESVTVVDVLNSGVCISGVLKFVAEYGLISVGASEFPDNRHVQRAALMYDETDGCSDDHCGYGNDYGDAKGDGHSEHYEYNFDYRPGLLCGYSNGIGNGLGYGYGYGYGSIHGGGSGNGSLQDYCVD